MEKDGQKISHSDRVGREFAALKLLAAASHKTWKLCFQGQQTTLPLKIKKGNKKS